MKCSCTSFKKKVILILLALMALQLIRFEVMAMNLKNTNFMKKRCAEPEAMQGQVVKK